MCSSPLLLITILFATGCSFSGLGSPLPDASPTLPDADEDCEPTCEGDTLVRCGELPVDCALGCNSASTSCNLLAASNNADSHGFAPSELGDWVIDNPAIINTDSGAVFVNGVQQRAGKVGIDNEIGFAMIDGAGVFVANSWTVLAGTSVVGSNSLIVVSAGDVRLEKILDVSAGQAECTTDPISCAGPGGGTGSTSISSAVGCANGGDGVEGSGTVPETGGGGGGHRQPGASGGNASDGDKAVGGNGGGVDPVDLCVSDEIVPLLGGSGGGRGGEEDGNNAIGGGAGGAIQISSSTAIRIIGAPNVSGIKASGNGGQGGNGGSGGGGGGAGGAILLEAPLITFENVTLAANGGGGGGGGGGGNGALGLFSLSPAEGGTAGAVGTAGGLGGASSDSAVAGDNGGDETGGGGGAAGRIRLNFNEIVGSSRIISPPPTEGDVRPRPGT